jgi:hypothetical protein
MDAPEQIRAERIRAIREKADRAIGLEKELLPEVNDLLDLYAALERDANVVAVKWWRDRYEMASADALAQRVEATRLRKAILKHLKYTACYDAELASCVRDEFGVPPERGVLDLTTVEERLRGVRVQTFTAEYDPVTDTITLSNPR